MAGFATAILTISAGTWVGAILFQTAVVAPAVFSGLDEVAARRFLRTVFPRFYRLGLLCGVLMLAGLVLLGGVAGWSATVLTLIITTGAMVILEAISLAMVPHINAARDAGEAGMATFSRLHGVSVLLTVIVLLLGLAVLATVAARAAVGL